MLKQLRKKHQQQISKAYADGWSTGYDIANSATLKESKKVFIKLLQKELRDGNIDYNDGIERSIQLIKEYK